MWVVKMEKIIKVTRNKKITTLRLSESTKQELESFGNSGETHEEILKKLMKLTKNNIIKSETELYKAGNVIGTKYGKLSRTFNIETEKNTYSIVCTFNDLSIMNLMLENKYIQEQGSFSKEWELDLEIVSLGIIDKNNYERIMTIWNTPDSLHKSDKQEYLLLYLIAVKQVFEETFSLKIFEINTQEDYFDVEKWRLTFIRNDLSMESFYNDIQKKIR